MLRCPQCLLRPTNSRFISVWCAGTAQATTTPWLSATLHRPAHRSRTPLGPPVVHAIALYSTHCSHIWLGCAGNMLCTACMQHPKCGYQGMPSVKREQRLLPMGTDHRNMDIHRHTMCMGGRRSERRSVVPDQVEQLHELPDQRSGLPGPARRLLRRPGHLPVLQRRYAPAHHQPSHMAEVLLCIPSSGIAVPGSAATHQLGIMLCPDEHCNLCLPACACLQRPVSACVTPRLCLQ